MFILPNKKGFEVIMYFLFEKLNPLQTKEEFRSVWDNYVNLLTSISSLKSDSNYCYLS